MSRWCDEHTEANQEVIMIEKKEIQVSHVILKTLLYIHVWKWVDCRKNDIKCSCQTSKIVMLLQLHRDTKFCSPDLALRLAVCWHRLISNVECQQLKCNMENEITKVTTIIMILAMLAIYKAMPHNKGINNPHTV